MTALANRLHDEAVVELLKADPSFTQEYLAAALDEANEPGGHVALIAAALADAERKGAAASGRCGAAPSAARSRRAMPCTTMATCAALLARCLSVVGVTR